jgi:uncharacterized protein
MVLTRHATLTQDHYIHASNYAYKVLDMLNPGLKYHNKAHTTNFVISSALDLSVKEGFNLEEQVIVGISAAFHDTGFKKEYFDHEISSAYFAMDYMTNSLDLFSFSHAEAIINTVRETSYDEIPRSKFSKVLCDADISYISSRVHFFKLLKDLKLESLNYVSSPLYSAARDDFFWYSNSLDFLTHVDWYTDTAKKLYNYNKTINVNKLSYYVSKLNS